MLKVDSNARPRWICYLVQVCGVNVYGCGRREERWGGCRSGGLLKVKLRMQLDLITASLLPALFVLASNGLGDDIYFNLLERFSVS